MCPKPGRVVNKGNTYLNPVFDLHLVVGPRMLAKLDRGLLIRNKRLHIELVIFVWAYQIAQFVHRCGGSDHLVDHSVGGSRTTESGPVGLAKVVFTARLRHEPIHGLSILDKILTYVFQLRQG